MSELVTRVLIVDDEPLARRHVRSMLSMDPDVVVVGECGNGRDAVVAIADQMPDIVLLDIQMPELDGFGVIERVGAEHMPVVVFVTAYDEYALKAFEVHAVDYVLKPINRDRLHKAMTHARSRVNGSAARAEQQAHMRALLHAMEVQRRQDERIAIKVDGRNIFVNTADIDWIEAVDDYARLHIGRTGYLIRNTLANLEKRLPATFLRIHRSLILNTDRIREIAPSSQGDYTLTLTDGVRVNSGRSYRAKVTEFLQTFTAENV